jgi:ribose transport system substrate-binding protein
MKKNLLAVLLAGLFLFAAACTPSSNNNNTTQGGDEGETYTIYLVTMDRMDQHWNSVQEGCLRAAGEIEAASGDKIEFVWDAPQDGKEDGPQVEIINNAVAAEADVILLAAHSADGQLGAITAGDEAGVKFIYVDSPASWQGALQTIKTDNEAAGTQAGEAMLAKLTELEITEGQIGVVSPDAGSESVVARDAGFRKAFEGTSFEILETQYGEGKADLSQNEAEDFITSGVVGLFGANEGSAVGVANAIKESGQSVVGVGFDTSATVLTAIEEDILIGTMAQNPKEMGYLGLKSAYEYLKNGTDPNPKLLDSGATMVTKANLADFK